MPRRPGRRQQNNRQIIAYRRGLDIARNAMGMVALLSNEASRELIEQTARYMANVGVNNAERLGNFIAERAQGLIENAPNAQEIMNQIGDAIVEIQQDVQRTLTNAGESVTEYMEPDVDMIEYEIDPREVPLPEDAGKSFHNLPWRAQLKNKKQMTLPTHQCNKCALQINQEEEV